MNKCQKCGSTENVLDLSQPQNHALLKYVEPGLTLACQPCVDTSKKLMSTSTAVEHFGYQEQKL